MTTTYDDDDDNTLYAYYDVFVFFLFNRPIFLAYHFELIKPGPPKVSQTPAIPKVPLGIAGAGTGFFYKPDALSAGARERKISWGQSNRRRRRRDRGGRGIYGEGVSPSAVYLEKGKRVSP